MKKIFANMSKKMIAGIITTTVALGGIGVGAVIYNPSKAVASEIDVAQLKAELTEEITKQVKEDIKKEYDPVLEELQSKLDKIATTGDPEEIKKQIDEIKGKLNYEYIEYTRQMKMYEEGTWTNGKPVKPSPRSCN